MSLKTLLLHTYKLSTTKLSYTSSNVNFKAEQLNFRFDTKLISMLVQPLNLIHVTHRRLDLGNNKDNTFGCKTVWRCTFLHSQRERCNIILEDGKAVLISGVVCLRQGKLGPSLPGLKFK